MTLKTASVMVLLLKSGLVWSLEPAVLKLDGATLRGDEELPAVQYIIPWENPQQVDLDVPENLELPSLELEYLDRYQYTFWLEQGNILSDTEARPDQRD